MGADELLPLELGLLPEERQLAVALVLAGIIFFFFFFLIVFALGGSPTPHPISSRPHFVCKFSRHGSSSPVTSHLAPSITVLVFPYSADAYSRTTASYRLTQLFRPNTRE